MRCYNKSEEYFKKYIDNQEKRIATVEKLNDKCLDDSSKIRLNLTLFELNKNLILAKCSLGYSKDLIENDAKSLISNAEVTFDHLPLSEKINVLCIKYLFRLEITSALQFLPELKNLLISSDSEVYKQFLNIINSDDTQNRLKEFMNDDWYNLCSDFSWFGTENNDSFAGYWSFVATAISKAKMIDSTEVKYIANNLL